ncbi:MAG TPA: hypothetical protein VJ779_02230 [Acetobacteraceae bacterium]|nr:hypothetical protein [Acetobacteraceae bacterium]
MYELRIDGRPNQSEWPSLAEPRHVAAHVINTGRLPGRHAAAHEETI